MGLERGQELRERHVVAGEGIDAVERHAADDPVVAVRGSEEVGAMRILADDEVGAPPADLARDVAPEVARVLDLAVWIAEERDPFDAERARRVPLLLFTDPGESLGGHRSIARALVAVGDDHVDDLAALLAQLRDGAARAELRVVGVRRHDHHTLDLVAQWNLLSLLNGRVGAPRACRRPPTIQGVLAAPATTIPIPRAPRL